MYLSGKVAVVTGGGRGLGRAYAEALAANGAAVVVNDVDADRTEQVVKEIVGAGGRAVGVVRPVGPTETANLLVEAAISEFGGLDVMVAGASVLRDQVLWKMSDEDFDTVIDVHLRGTFTCARAAAARMRARGTPGRLILTSSLAGQRGSFGQTNYAAAKAGIVAMARTWAMELAKSKITVNAVVPAALAKTIPAFAVAIEQSERDRCLSDWLRKDEGLGSVEDVAPLIVFLASDASADITGQAIGIGGDKLALWTHPKEKSVAYADYGWTPEAIAAQWDTGVGAEPETYGIMA